MKLLKHIALNFGNILIFRLSKQNQKQLMIQMLLLTFKEDPKMKVDTF